MLNKNDPLIGAVQEVIKKNHAEREAARVVNETFGIADRKALPHERQHEWDAAYQQVLSEGKITHPNQQVLNVHEPEKPELTSDDFRKLRAMRVKKKSVNEQELSSKQAYDVGRGVQQIATKPFGKPGFNMAGRSAATGTTQGTVPTSQGPVKARITANRVDAPGGYSQATVTATRPSGSPIGSVRMDSSGARITQIGAKRVNEQMKDPNARDVTSPSGAGIKKPDYATGTPDYAKPKTQTVNRAAKTSLPVPDNRLGTGTLQGRAENIAKQGNSEVMKTGKKSSSVMPSTMKEEQLDEKAPPGREDQVMELKKKFPKKRAFAMAWSSYNKSKKNKES